ncbi:cation diffusion facilitator family transporter [Kurthia zopfii]|uniref:cation diffusion facilitator family transporter n=1 Tax=Kurthia zopfii TaxID=1650 RepID=UPI000F6E92FC|nr:cation diffusion facilitator family transporter [Kurthia zopfii]VEI07348.1 Cadmium, cobalt and zinc/H(+)-K(+) antiporter [Kurthia zopfii]
MFEHLFNLNNHQNNRFVNRYVALLFLASMFELFGYSRSHSLTQLATSGFIAIVAVSILLEKSIQSIHYRSLSQKKNYLYFRFEILVPLFLSIGFMLFSGLVVFFISQQNASLHANSALLTYSTIGLLLTSFIFFKLVKSNNQFRSSRTSTLILLSYFSPFVISFLVAALQPLYQNPQFDRVGAFFIALLILYFCTILTLKSSKFLMVGSPQKLDLVQLTSDLKSFDSIKKIHSVQAWTISSDLFGVKCQLSVSNNGRKPQHIVDELTDFILNRHNIEYIDVEIIHQNIQDNIDL